MSDNNTKVAAMIWMALDPRTPEGEAVASLTALRRMEVSMNDLKTALGAAAAQVKIVERVPEFLDPAMPFGKHKGKKLSEIAEDAPGYLHWLLENVELKEFLRNQIELAILEGGE